MNIWKIYIILMGSWLMVLNTIVPMPQWAAYIAILLICLLAWELDNKTND